MLFDPELGCSYLDGWFSLDEERLGLDESWWYEDGDWPATVDLRSCLWRYLSLITSQHNQMPRYMCTVAWFTWAMCSGNRVARWLPTLFDVDTARGIMLDMVGEWVGIPRRISVEPPTIGYFSLNIAGLGLNEARWFGPDAATGTLFVLDDDEYRLVLQTRILANHWDGTRQGAYDVLNHYFGEKGYDVLIDDNYAHGQGWFTFDDPNPALGWEQGYWDQTDEATVYPCHGNMWMDLILYGPWPLNPTLLMLALFTGGYFDVRPAGVGINYWRNDYALPGEPMFGWDEGPETGAEFDAGWVVQRPYMAGWDMGAWALRIEPLQFRPASGTDQTQPQARLMHEEA